MEKKRFLRILAFALLFSPISLIIHDIVPRITPFSAFLSVKCLAEETTEIFAKDIGKQKEVVEEDFNKIEEALLKAKLQDARSACDIVEFKINRMKSKLTKKEMSGFRQRVDKKRKIISVKEDSLVVDALEIFHTQGADASLHYVENDLKMHGVEENKIIALEKKILNDAPAVQQTLEHREIERAIKILEKGELPDSSMNPYVLKSAQIIVKAKTDSLQRIEGIKKFRELEKRENTEPEVTRHLLEYKESETEQINRSQPLKREAMPTPSEIQPKERNEIISDTNETGKKSLSKIETVIGGPHTDTNFHVSEQFNDAKDQLASNLVQSHLQTIKTNRNNAQDRVMELYGLLENKKGNEALDLFKRNRDSIAPYVDSQVFTILEQAIMQSVIESQSKDSGDKVETLKTEGEKISTSPNGTFSEMEHLKRINGFLRDNKIEAAYTEFKRNEKRLKQEMEKNEFKQLKKMIENAYKTRYPGK